MDMGVPYIGWGVVFGVYPRDDPPWVCIYLPQLLEEGTAIWGVGCLGGGWFSGGYPQNGQK